MTNGFHRLYRFFSVLLLVITISNCGYLTKAEYAKQEVVKEVNRTIPLIEVLQSSCEAAYETEQRLVLFQASEQNVTKEEVQSRISKVRQKWDPLWAKFAKLRQLNLSLKTIVDANFNIQSMPEALKLIEQIVTLEKEAAEQFASLKVKK